MLSKKKAELDDLGGTQSLHVTKEVRMKNIHFFVKTCSEISRVWLNNFLLKRLDMWLTDPINHLSRSQEEKQEFCRKDLWEPNVFRGMNHLDLQRISTRFMKMLHWQKYCKPGLKRTKTEWNEESLFVEFLGENNLTGLCVCKHSLTLKRKEGLWGQSSGCRG